MKRMFLFVGLILSISLGAEDPNIIGYNGFLVIQLFEHKLPPEHRHGIPIVDWELD